MLLSVGLLALSQVTQVFSAPMTLGTKGIERRNASTACKADNSTPNPSDPAARTEYRRYKQHDFKTKDTDKFAVNGSGLPDVDFDIGTSFAGSIPLAKDNATGQDMFFWFFPSTVDLPEPEIPLIVWLNGGPGCSSMEGVLQENGPFVWSPGAYKPVRNPFSWNNLAHILYVDQPVGTGFSQGKVTAENDEDAAKQFAEFLKRFQETFAIKGKKIYLAGESYAGYFHPYIGREMIHRQDKDYFDFQGALLFNPALNSVLNSGKAQLDP
ncbi:hypothetical protein KEM55_001308 [Ascosphaera atra]|nr:hypothetical protein KEM55_001308 [Ascosphaera atra]